MMVDGSIWERNAHVLSLAFSDGSEVGRSLSVDLILLALEPHLPDSPCRVIDVGGGGGHVGIRLAELGHEVVIVDSDLTMVDATIKNISLVPQQVRELIKVVHATGESSSNEVGGGYDVLCCHSVIMYQDSPLTFLSEILELVSDEAVVSISSINPDSSAMRLGLQERWAEAIATLSTGLNCDTRCIATNNISRVAVSKRLSDLGFDEIGWYGIGIFTDYLCEAVVASDIRQVIAAEWLAGCSDPYRAVARCFHILGRRGSPQ